MNLSFMQFFFSSLIGPKPIDTFWLSYSGVLYGTRVQACKNNFFFKFDWIKPIATFWLSYSGILYGTRVPCKFILFYFISSLIGHDIGGDLQNFCMTGPSGRDLYKTYPNLQGIGKKKKPNQQTTQIAISVLDLQWRDAISGVEDCVAGGCSPYQAWERVRSDWSINVISKPKRWWAHWFRDWHKLGRFKFNTPHYRSMGSEVAHGWGVK